MRRQFKEKPKLGQGFTVLILSFFCLIGVGISDFSYTMFLKSELGGGQTGEISLTRRLCSLLCGFDPSDLTEALEKGCPLVLPVGKRQRPAAEGKLKNFLLKALFTWTIFL